MNAMCQPTHLCKMFLSVLLAKIYFCALVKCVSYLVVFTQSLFYYLLPCIMLYTGTSINVH